MVLSGTKLWITATQDFSTPISYYRTRSNRTDVPQVYVLPSYSRSMTECKSSRIDDYVREFIPTRANDHSNKTEGDRGKRLNALNCILLVTQIAIHAKYLVRYDGAHSWGYKSLGRSLERDQLNEDRGVQDSIPLTHFSGYDCPH